MPDILIWRSCDGGCERTPWTEAGNFAAPVIFIGQVEKASGGRDSAGEHIAFRTFL
jgi:hypothetical protein